MCVCVCVYVTESLCCTPKTNTTLQNKKEKYNLKKLKYIFKCFPHLYLLTEIHFCPWLIYNPNTP